MIWFWVNLLISTVYRDQYGPPTLFQAASMDGRRDSYSSPPEAAESESPAVKVTDVDAGLNKTVTASPVPSVASATKVSSRMPHDNLISSQPVPVSQPSIPFEYKQFTPRRNPPMFLRTLTVILAILKILFVYAIPGSIFVALVLVFVYLLQVGCALTLFTLAYVSVCLWDLLLALAQRPCKSFLFICFIPP